MEQAIWHRYGIGNWRIAYRWGKIIIPRREGIQLYEDGYYEFLKNNTNTLEWIVSTASEVYDTAQINVQSGLDYEVQETPNNHIHDIAIRRSVLRLGREFRGDHLVRVRWKDSEGFRLSPGIVPFHLPRMIVQGQIDDYGKKGIWWNDGTIEDFYQRNKVLQINDE